MAGGEGDTAIHPWLLKKRCKPWEVLDQDGNCVLAPVLNRAFGESRYTFHRWTEKELALLVGMDIKLRPAFRRGRFGSEDVRITGIYPYSSAGSRWVMVVDLNEENAEIQTIELDWLTPERIALFIVEAEHDEPDHEQIILPSTGHYYTFDDAWNAAARVWKENRTDIPDLHVDIIVGNYWDVYGNTEGESERICYDDRTSTAVHPRFLGRREHDHELLGKLVSYYHHGYGTTRYCVVCSVTPAEHSTGSLVWGLWADSPEEALSLYREMIHLRLQGRPPERSRSAMPVNAVTVEPGTAIHPWQLHPSVPINPRNIHIIYAGCQNCGADLSTRTDSPKYSNGVLMESELKWWCPACDQEKEGAHFAVFPTMKTIKRKIDELKEVRGVAMPGIDGDWTGFKLVNSEWGRLKLSSTVHLLYARCPRCERHLVFLEGEPDEQNWRWGYFRCDVHGEVRPKISADNTILLLKESFEEKSSAIHQHFRRYRIPKHLYHGTYKGFLDEISSSGLLPTGEMDREGELLDADTSIPLSPYSAPGYVFLTTDLEQAKKYARYDARHIKKEKSREGRIRQKLLSRIKDTTPVVLGIDTSVLDRRHFSKDYLSVPPSWRYKGIIPPEAIKVFWEGKKRKYSAIHPFFVHPEFLRKKTGRHSSSIAEDWNHMNFGERRELVDDYIGSSHFRMDPEVMEDLEWDDLLVDDRKKIINYYKDMGWMKSSAIHPLFVRREKEDVVREKVSTFSEWYKKRWSEVSEPDHPLHHEEDYRYGQWLGWSVVKLFDADCDQENFLECLKSMIQKEIDSCEDSWVDADEEDDYPREYWRGKLSSLNDALDTLYSASLWNESVRCAHCGGSEKVKMPAASITRCSWCEENLHVWCANRCWVCSNPLCIEHALRCKKCDLAFCDEHFDDGLCDLCAGRV